jgi:hypothetical protein
MLVSMTILKMYLKVKICEVNKKKRNLHIANGAYIIHVHYQNKGQNMKKYSLLR